MMTVSQAVREIMTRSPFLEEALGENIANVTHVARLIEPKIRDMLFGKKISEASISMALRRLPRRESSRNAVARILKGIRHVALRAPLIEFSFPKTLAYSKISRGILEIAEGRPELFCIVSGGVSDAVAIVSEELEADISTTIKLGPEARIIRDLGSITINMPIESIDIPGAYYPILRALAWENISMIELVSMARELTIVLKRQDLDRALTSIIALGKAERL